MSDQPIKDDAYWRDKLTEEEFYICRQKGTERAFTGKYWDSKVKGKYLCRCCGAELFDSDAKYDSGSGWPSFYEALSKQSIKENLDETHGMVRTEIVCRECDCHLGHVFTDGPQPTGLRYCVNSASIQLDADSEAVGEDK